MFLTLFLLFPVFLALLALADARIAERDVPPPQRLDIPVNMHSSQVYSVNVNMSSNASPQAFSFALSTSTALQAPAAIPAEASLRITPPPLRVGGVVREYCGLLQSNGSAWVYPNQPVTVANQSASFFSPGVSGIIGMGLAPFDASPAANWLSRNPAQPVFSLGMALNPPSNFSTDGDITWKPMLAPSASTPSNLSSWFVEMDAWASGTELLTFIDPLYSNITQISRGRRNTPPPPLRTQWKLPCNSKFRLTVTFGTFTTSLDQASLVVKQADGVCVGALQEWIDAAATEYLLGSPFIAALYLRGPGPVGVAGRVPASNKLSAGALAGAYCFTSVFLRRSAMQPRKRKFSKTDVTPFPSDFTQSTTDSRRSLRNSYNNGLAAAAAGAVVARLADDAAERGGTMTP
ncbi:hypothetical protein C8R46DRAFT_1229168 [Mycena filopes]|nr:hypothetical protein C8R46DRAFT_1229168 [Mycena filopes]